MLGLFYATNFKSAVPPQTLLVISYVVLLVYRSEVTQYPVIIVVECANATSRKVLYAVQCVELR